jgi:signal transduction histidine kinase
LRRDRKGAPVAILETNNDITQRKRAEQERERLRQLEADLAHLNRVRPMGELVASISHELKQPIAAAITDAKACLQWLKRDQPDVKEAREATIADMERGPREPPIGRWLILPAEYHCDADVARSLRRRTHRYELRHPQLTSSHQAQNAAGSTGARSRSVRLLLLLEQILEDELAPSAAACVHQRAALVELSQLDGCEPELFGQGCHGSDRVLVIAR